MLTRVSAKDARDNFTDLLGSVYYGNQVVAIDRKGRTFAVVVNPEEYRALKKTAKGKFFEVVADIQSANRAVDEDQVLEDVTKAVEEVRKELYAKNE